MWSQSVMTNYQHFLVSLGTVLCLLLPLTIADKEFLDKECDWSYCAGKMIRGQGTCDLIKGGIYTPRSWNGTGCAWDAHRVECCKECYWGKRCHAGSYSGDRACQEDFGGDWKHTGHLHPPACKTAWEARKQFRCCRIYY